MTWAPDSFKLEMGRLTRLLDLFALRISDTSSLITSDWRRDILQNRLHRLPYLYALRAVSRLPRIRPTLITDRPWDTLIILDACRYDVFQTYWSSWAKAHHAESTVPFITSPGSHTTEWVIANFVRNPHREMLKDVTIVTANPYSSRQLFEMNEWSFPLVDSVDVWRDFWDTDLKTVMPQAVYEVAMNTDHARLIVHFMQPHFPYIGSCDIGPQENFRDRYAPGIWWRVKTGDISVEKAMTLYIENLDLVMKWAMKLTDSISGRTIITSDHGNLFGEYGLYWHPPGLHVPELVTVPWLEVGTG